MWIIKDWADNEVFPDKEFESFEDGWDYIMENVEDEGDNTYDDYYVEKAD